jgi:hypothetical protein
MFCSVDIFFGDLNHFKSESRACTGIYVAFILQCHFLSLPIKVSNLSKNLIVIGPVDNLDN